MKNVLTSEDICSCSITAYKSLEGVTGKERAKLIKEYDKQNEELASIVSHLGYGFKPTQSGFRYENGIASGEPGFRISLRPATQKEVEIFKEEMIKLGVKYGQWSILLKLPNEKPSYVFTNEKKGVGKVDISFDTTKDTNTKGFEYGVSTEESLEECFKMTEEELKEVKCKPYSCYWNTVRGIERQRLGLKGDPNKTE